MDQAAQLFSHGEGEEETGEKRDGGKYLEKENVGGPSTFLSLFFFSCAVRQPFHRQPFRNVYNQTCFPAKKLGFDPVRSGRNLVSRAVRCNGITLDIIRVFFPS